MERSLDYESEDLDSSPTEIEASQNNRENISDITKYLPVLKFPPHKSV